MRTIHLDDRYDFVDLSEGDLNRVRSETYSAIRVELARLGFSENCCALGAPDAGGDGVVCLHDESGLWVFYVAERGRRFAQAFFSSSWDAANYLVWYLCCSPKGGNSDVGRLYPVGSPN